MSIRASSIHVDLDSNVAAFASINAMQGYRPTAVTEYAVRLLRAQKDVKELPAPPAIVSVMELEHPEQYAGRFTATDGKAVEFAVEGKGLVLVAEGKNGGARKDVQSANLGEFGDDVLGDPIAQVLVLLGAAQVFKKENRYGFFRRLLHAGI